MNKKTLVVSTIIAVIIITIILFKSTVYVPAGKVIPLRSKSPQELQVEFNDGVLNEIKRISNK